MNCPTILASASPPSASSSAGRTFTPASGSGALLMAFIGFGLSALSTGLAITLALWHRLKLWIDSGVNQARRDNVWPPPDLPRGRRNRVGWLMGTALILTVVPAVIIL